MIDIILLIIIAFGAIMGYMKGVFSQLSIILGALVGYTIAKVGASDINKLLMDFGVTKNEEATFLAYVVCIVVCILLSMLLFKILEKVLKAVKLNFVNRLIGALLGALKYLIIILLIASIFNKFGMLPFDTEGTVFASLLSVFDEIKLDK